MKIEHHIRLDQTESGHVLIRFEKRTTNDAGEIVERIYHRTSVEPGVALDDQMAPVKAHLAQLGFQVPDEASMGEMRKRVAAIHTPERVAAFRAAKAKKPA